MAGRPPVEELKKEEAGLIDIHSVIRCPELIWI